jgi:DNA repair exonuclease SbcCD nuclease subunit
LRLPPLAHRFGPDAEEVPLHPDSPVAVAGVSARPAGPALDLPQTLAGASSAPLTIGLLYGDVAPWQTSLPALDITYWALGSRHRREVVRAHAPVSAYPGTPQGVHAGEAGPGGVFLVDIAADGEVALRFEALDVVRWAQIELATAAGETEAALLERLTSQVDFHLGAALGRPVLYQLNLGGDAWPAGVAGVDDIAEQLNELYAGREVFAWCYRATRRREPLAERHKRMQADDLVAHVLRLSDELQSDSALRRRLWAEFAVLLDDERFKPHRASAGLTEEQLTTLIRAAEAAVLDALGTPA